MKNLYWKYSYYSRLESIIYKYSPVKLKYKLKNNFSFKSKRVSSFVEKKYSIPILPLIFPTLDNHYHAPLNELAPIG